MKRSENGLFMDIPMLQDGMEAAYLWNHLALSRDI